MIATKTAMTGSNTKSSQPAAAESPTTPNRATRTGVKQHRAATPTPIVPVISKRLSVMAPISPSDCNDGKNSECHLSETTRRPSFRGRTGGCAHPQRPPRVARRSGPEDDPVCHWIVIRHKLANETTRLDSQGIRPNQIAVRMNAGPPVLELGNDHVGFLSHPLGQLGLGQAAFVPQLAQP